MVRLSANTDTSSHAVGQLQRGEGADDRQAAHQQRQRRRHEAAEEQHRQQEQDRERQHLGAREVRRPARSRRRWPRRPAELHAVAVSSSPSRLAASCCWLSSVGFSATARYCASPSSATKSRWRVVREAVHRRDVGFAASSAGCAATRACAGCRAAPSISTTTPVSRWPASWSCLAALTVSVSGWSCRRAVSGIRRPVVGNLRHDEWAPSGTVVAITAAATTAAAATDRQRGDDAASTREECRCHGLTSWSWSAPPAP